MDYSSDASDNIEVRGLPLYFHDTPEKAVTHPEQFLCLAVLSTHTSSNLICFITYCVLSLLFTTVKLCKVINAL